MTDGIPNPRPDRGGRGVRVQKAVTFVGAAILLLAGSGLAIAADESPRSSSRSTSAIVTQLPVATLAAPDPTVDSAAPKTSAVLPLRSLDKIEKGSHSTAGARASASPSRSSGSESGPKRRGRASADRKDHDDDEREVVSPPIRDEDDDDHDDDAEEGKDGEKEEHDED